MVLILAGRTIRAERARRRARIILDDAALSDKTQRRYYLALRKLLPYMEACKDKSDLDNWMCRWVRKMWGTGEPLLTVGDGLSALHFHQPWTRRAIPHAWKLFNLWRRIEIPSRVPPLTLRLVRSLAAYELNHNNLEMCCLLLLSFYCLLRTGEALSLTTSDFVLGPTQGLVSLKGTKSGKRNQANEVVSITDVVALDCLRALLDARKEQRLQVLPLWSSSGARFRQCFRALCQVFDLSSFGFRPYSLRRGGARHVFQTTQSMEAALLRGRWEFSKVARIYISDGLSFLPFLKMSLKTQILMERHFLIDKQMG